MAIETLRPNAAGDETNQTPVDGASNYENVDEETPDGDTTYNIISTLDWERDFYELPAHSVGAGTINHITVYAVVRASATPVQTNLKIAIKSGDTVDEGAEITVTVSYESYSKQWTTNPDTSSAWTWEEIDSLQIGDSIRLPAMGQNTRCTQVYVDVDFTAGVTHELAGVIGGVASVSGIALITRGLAGLASGVCGASGLAVIAYRLAGIAQGLCSVSGATAITRTLAGLSAGKAAITGNLLKIKWLAGVIAGACSTSSSILITRGLAGLSAGKALATASLINIKWLAGVIAGVATVTGDLFHVRTAIRVLSAVRNLLAVRNIPPVR